LAATLWAQGDRAGARALLEQVVEARRRVLGAEHPDTVTSMNILASTLGPQGVRARVRALLEQVLKALRRIPG
ncbi:MAG: tetratricopeptide repeat protein, partial [Rhodospirillaceae bacterium]